MLSHNDDNEHNLESQNSEPKLAASKKVRILINCKNCNFKSPRKHHEKYSGSLDCLACVISEAANVRNDKKLKRIRFSDGISVPNADLELIVEIMVQYRHYVRILRMLHQERQQNVLNSNSISLALGKLNEEINFKQFFKNVISYLTKGEFVVFKSKLVKVNSLKTKRRAKEAISGFQNDLENKQFFTKLRQIVLDEKNISEILSLLFLGPEMKDNNLEVFKSTISHLDPVFSYKIIHFPMFNVEIYEIKEEAENLYLVHDDLGNKSEIVYDQIINSVIDDVELIYGDTSPIGEMLDNFRKKYQQILKINYKNLNNAEIINLAIRITLIKLNLEKLFPLLVDRQITEIYFDDPESDIYIDHVSGGRCVTNLSLTGKEIETIKTVICLESNKQLDYSNPSIKYTLHNKYFNCRIALDIRPLTQSPISIDIRKLNNIIFSLDDLIVKKSLSSEIAGFLLFCVIHKLNITVVGATNTGKTTLINALDYYVPRKYRKIYVEEAPESIDQKENRLHQLKLIVNAKSRDKTLTQKTEQIYRLLHRNPDFIYLGEILNKEEAHAMFHCLSAGLIGFQTIHARSLDSLINRWQHHFAISPHCFNDLDIVVFMKRLGERRYIDKICCLNYKDEVSIEYYSEYDYTKENWSINHEFLKTPLLKKRIEQYGYSADDINSVIDAIEILMNSFIENPQLARKLKTDVFQYLVTLYFNNSFRFPEQNAQELIRKFISRRSV